MSLTILLVNFVLYFLLPAAFVGYLWLQKRSLYWKERNIPGPQPTWKFLAGNMTGVGTKVSLPEKLDEFYKEYKGKTPAVGIFTSASPALLVIDPELAKTILVRDFAKFQDHGMYSNERDDPLSATLFNLEGAKWKALRSKLSPTFTSGKLKMMFSSIEQTGDRFIKVLDKSAKDQSAIEMKNLSTRFTADVVGSTAFGIDINSLANPENELFEVSRKIMDSLSSNSVGAIFRQTFQDLSRLLRLPGFPKDCTQYFMSLLNQTVTDREMNGVKRNDFLQLLIQLKNNGFLDDEAATGKEAEKMTFNQIAAQAFIFFFAGFDTSSSVMNFTFYQLATHRDIQEKARQEVNEKIAKHGGKLTYEALMEMEYLNQVFHEAMRINPPVFFLMRKANEDYVVPNTKMKIDKGSQVLVASYSFQIDPEYFPNPAKFDPERFTKENIAARQPFTFLPFGEGPRICIGNRFAQLQSRFAIALLLKNFDLTLSEKTKQPMQFEKDFLGWAPIGGIWLNVKRI